ncbi:MAG: peptidase M28, partial [Gammaproteobacteria bacterium]
MNRIPPFFLVCSLLLVACDEVAVQTPMDAQSQIPAPAASEAAAEVDGYAGATAAAEPEVPGDLAEQQYEDELLSNTRLLVTDSLRSGEGYFSADGGRFIYQSEQLAGNPFYQIFLMDLTTEQSELVSTGTGLTTCSWIHPTLDRIMYSSTHEDPSALEKQQDEIAFRESGEERAYGWDYDRHYDIYQADSNGGNVVNLTNTDGYDAEGSYSSDGSKILFASNREAYSRTLSAAEQQLFDDDPSYFMDLYIMDADGSSVVQLTHSPGYDGGPFFSPDGERVVWRRFNPDGNSAEVWTMNV